MPFSFLLSISLNFMLIQPVCEALNITNASSIASFVILPGYRMSSVFASMSLESNIKCARRCVREGNCTAASYDVTGQTCELHDGWDMSNTSLTEVAQGWELLTLMYNFSEFNFPVQYWLCDNTTSLESVCMMQPFRYFNFGDYSLTPGCNCECCYFIP